MPAKNQKQANLMSAALHGASFPAAKAIRQSMAPNVIREFTKVAPKHHGANLGKYLHASKKAR